MGHCSSSHSLGKDIWSASHQGAEEHLVPLLLLVPIKDRKLAASLLNYQNRKNKCTPLMAAVEGGHLRCVQLLLEAGADPNIQNGQGETVLHLSILHPPAADTTHPLAYAREFRTATPTAMIQLLLRSGADPNIQTRKGNSALHVALLEEDEDTALLLLENDKDTDINTRASYHMNLDILNTDGHAALHLSIIRGISSPHRNHVALLLIDLGADVECRESAQPPLIMAVLHDNDEMALALLHAGAGVNALDVSVCQLTGMRLSDEIWWQNCRSEAVGMADRQHSISGEGEENEEEQAQHVETAVHQILSDLEYPSLLHGIHNIHQSSQGSAFSYAIENDNVAIATALLERGVDDSRLLYGFNAHNQRVALDAKDLYGFSSPLSLIDVATSDAMARLLLKATCAAVLWTRRKHFMLFLYFGRYLGGDGITHESSVCTGEMRLMQSVGEANTAVNRVFDISDLTRYICMFL